MTANSMGLSYWRKLKTLFIPSIFPSLVTGLATAAGAAWNACIVSEYITYDKKLFVAHGLGALINAATVSKNFPDLVAGLSVMMLVIIGLNRTLWAWLYTLSQTRFRMDL
jgi:NitT/TauT family transport system permease protein